MRLTPIKISNRSARQLWLTSQGLRETPTGPLDLLKIIRALGFVQLDTIQVVARAHHHILWSRNQNYREPMLNALLVRDRAVFEHFTHDASIIPMEFLPMWRRQFRRKKAQISRPGWLKDLPDETGRDAIRARIESEGALSTHSFDSKVSGPRKMWARPPHKQALEYMWYSGELATSHRINFTKYYDLAERVFPKHLRDIELSDREQIEWLCEAALDRLGFGTLGEVQRFWDAVDGEETRAWSEDASEHVWPIEFETVKGEWVKGIAPADIEERLVNLKPCTSRLRILNPFDPVVRDRRRLSRIFGFDYRVEMFVPAAKRVWGYYVYPILEGDRFVGRIEIVADRRSLKLTVLNFWLEHGVRWSARRQEKLEAELSRIARFVGLKRVIWDGKRAT